MANGWQTVPLGEFLMQRKEFFTISDFTRYKRARVQLHGRGIVLRDEIDGIEVKTKEQQAARTGEFLVAEIDAKLGGFGIVPSELNNAIVSSHYFLFEINEYKCQRKWLDWFIRSGLLEEQVTARGSTNYAAIRPSHVLKFVIPLPPLSEQIRLLTYIQELAIRIENAKDLRTSSISETECLLEAGLYHVFSDLKNEKLPIGDFSVILRGRGPEYLEGSNKKVINQKCVKWVGIDLRYTKEVSEQWYLSLSEKYFLHEGDIVVNSTGEGTIGRACVVTSDTAGLPFDSHVLAIKVQKNKILPQFIAYYLRSPMGQASINDAKGATTTNQTELGTEKLRNISLPVPPLEEQRRLVAYLDGLQGQVSALRAVQAETGKELSALMPSVLDRAFKGEL